MYKFFATSCSLKEIEYLVLSYYNIDIEGLYEITNLKRFSVDGVLDNYAEMSIEDVQNGFISSFELQHFLDLLCRDGYIEIGIYIIGQS